MFFTLGLPKSLRDLDTFSVRMKTIERNKIPILVVDDEDFVYEDHLKQHRFDLTHFDDVDAVEVVKEYEIILCDIAGVGKRFNSKYQGAHVIGEIRKKYPFKTIIAYTGQTHDATYNRFFKLADMTVKKDIDGDEWVERLDEALSITTDPKKRWMKIRDYLIENNVSLFEIVKLENEYVDFVLNKKDFKDFPSKRLSRRVSPDVQAVLSSFTASVVFKLISAAWKN